MTAETVKPAWKIQAPEFNKLVTRRGMLAGAMAIVAAPFGTMATTTDGLFNDFYTYWAASSLLNSGGNPYDLDAIARVLHAYGMSGLLVGGYSYPLFLAELMRPLTLLQPNIAAAVFAVFSLAALGIAVAVLASGIPRLALDEAIWFGAASGFMVPVSGSLYFGQANLVLLPFLALAYRGVAAEWCLAAAASVKVYPVSGMLATLLSPISMRERIGRLAPPLLALAVALVAAGGAVGLNSRRSQLLGPDPFWSNQSITGFVSRLSLASDRTDPPLPGLPVEPVVIALSLALLIATAGVLWHARNGPFDGRLALAVWAGMVIAPRNSLWNLTPLLLCFAFAWPALRAGNRVRILVGIAALAVEAQAFIDRGDRKIWYVAPAVTWTSSFAFYGTLIVGAVVAYLLVRARPVPQNA